MAARTEAAAGRVPAPRAPAAVLPSAPVSTPGEAEAHPVLLFDGVCNLCQGTVQFAIARDPKARIRFASLQSAAGRAAIEATGHRDPLPDSIVWIHEGRLRVKSTAALAVARWLRWPWPLLTVFWIVPYPIRDWIYSWIAKNRYRWFGKQEQCWVPTPALRARFLDADES